MKLSRTDFDSNEVVPRDQISSVIKKSLDRRTSVSVVPDPERLGDQNYDGVRFLKTKFELITLIMLLHYSEIFGEFRDYVAYEIELDLDRRLIFPELNASLFSKSVFDYFLELYINKHGTHHFFGKICNEEQINYVIDNFRFRFDKPTKVCRPIFRRGYRDKGSLRPETRWLPKDDFSFTEQQIRIENRRAMYQELVIQFVRQSGDRVLKSQRVRKEE